MPITGKTMQVRRTLPFPLLGSDIMEALSAFVAEQPLSKGLKFREQEHPYGPDQFHYEIGQSGPYLHQHIRVSGLESAASLIHPDALYTRLEVASHQWDNEMLLVGNFGSIFDSVKNFSDEFLEWIGLYLAQS